MDLTEVFKCPECSGELRYDIPEQRLVCSFCSKRFLPEEYEKAVSGGAASQDYSSGAEPSKFTPCPHCGCRISRGALRASAGCPVCFEPLNAVNPPGDADLPPEPDFILPFLLDREEFVKKARKIIGERDFLPDSFVNATEASVQALYVPFCLFDVSVSGRAEYRAEDITEISTGRSTSYRHTVLAGHAAGQQYYLNVPAGAAGSLEASLTQSLEPFFCEDARPFSKVYGAGLKAQVLENGRQGGYQEARGRIIASFDRFLTNAEIYKLIKINSNDYHEVPEKVSYAWFPVWLMEFTWQGEKWGIYMNGQTGKYVESLPVSTGKNQVWGSSLMLFAFGFIFWLELGFLKLSDLLALCFGAFFGVLILTALLLCIPFLKKSFATKLRAAITGSLLLICTIALYAGTILLTPVKTESVIILLAFQILMLMVIFVFPLFSSKGRRPKASRDYSGKERRECDEYAIPSRNVLHERKVQTVFTKTVKSKESMIDKNS